MISTLPNLHYFPLFSALGFSNECLMRYIYTLQESNVKLLEELNDGKKIDFLLLVIETINGKSTNLKETF
jgi:hypothetical protein